MSLETILEELRKSKQPKKVISIEQTLKEKGELWLMSAMIEGSIGYHSAEHAKRLIQDYMNGERRDSCERCYCCYGSDLEAMIMQDVEHFLYLEKHNQEKVERTMKYAKQTMDLSGIDQMTASMVYPTAI